MNGLPIVVYNSYTIVNSGRELVENTPLRRQKAPSQALCICQLLHEININVNSFTHSFSMIFG